MLSASSALSLVGQSGVWFWALVEHRMDVVKAPVVFNRQETPSVWRLGFEYDAPARAVRAARFIMLADSNVGHQPMPRPFSISDVRTDEQGRTITEILYKPIGRVTSWLSGLRQGDSFEVGGLLGNGFPLPKEGLRPVLMAGGIGNAPFAYQVRELLAAGFDRDPPKIVLFLAGRSEADVWIQPWVEDSGITIVRVTDDGSVGDKGLITDAFMKRRADLGPLEAYACGPEPMLRAVQNLALSEDFRCHLSVEERMACGYGVCNACIVEERCEGVPRGDGWFLRACIDGPVFEAQEIWQ